MAPQKPFETSLDLRVGNERVALRFIGEGHTMDNIVGYFPKDSVLFGGCLVKALNAGKGYLGDADTVAWPVTIGKVKAAFPDTKIVVPGHGDPGGMELLSYTQRLFEDR